MIWHFAIKKIFLIVVAIVISLSALQISILQREIIQIFLSNIRIINYKSNGFFPFNFSIEDLCLKHQDFDILADKISIKLNSKMFHVKHFVAGKVKIKQTNVTKLCPSDFLMLAPIILQKAVKRIEIQELNLDDEIFNNISLEHMKKNSKLSASARFGEIVAYWAMKDEILKGAVGLNDISMPITLDLSNKILEVSYEDVKLRGGWNDEYFDGCVEFGDFSSKVKIGVHEEFFKIDFKNDSIGLRGKIDYNLDKFKTYVYDVEMDNYFKFTPFEIDNSLRVSDFSVLFKEGKISIKGMNFSSDQFSLGKCTISNVNLSKLKDLEFKGVVNGVGEYTDSKETLKLNIKDLEFGGFKFSDLDLKSTHSAEEMQISAIFNLFDKKQKLDCSIYTKDWLIKKDSKLNVKTQGSFVLNDLKVGTAQKVRGVIDYNVSLTGFLKAPILSGNIAIKNGVYVNLNSGTYIRDIGLLFDLKDNIVQCKKIYARDDSKSGGELKGGGQIKYEDGQLKTDIQAKIEDFKVIDQKWLKHGRVFGDIMFKGDLLKEVKVYGKFYSKAPEVDISGIVMLSMRSTDLIVKKKKRKNLENTFPVKFPVDISLEIKPDLRIHGSGLNSTWTGEAKVFGDLLDPEYIAVAKLKNGQIELTDNTFKLKQGDVSINKDDMEIQVSAEKQIEKFLVGVKFNQKGGESKVSFYSNPYMTDRDVLSYILFGKNASEISMGECMTLLTIMNKLSGETDFDILGRMKTIFGIDTIAIKKNRDSSGDEYNSLSLGKKLGKFKVSVEQATGKDDTSVVVEADVAKNTKVSVDLSSRDSFGGGVLWNRRY